VRRIWLCSAVFVLGSEFQKPTYSILDLGTLGGPSEAVALNDAGQVVGIYFRSSQIIRGFLWAAGKLKDLGTLGGQNTMPSSLNDRGQVVGSSQSGRGGDRRSVHPFFWSEGLMLPLPPLEPGVEGEPDQAFAISRSGRIAGVSLRRGNRQASIWRGGRPEPVGPASEDGTVARGINERGDVIINVGEGPLETAFYLAAGAGSEVEQLGGVDGSHAVALGLNNRLQAVGYSIARDGRQRAVLWQASGRATVLIRGKDLGTLPGFPKSQAMAINDRGQIVGRVYEGTGKSGRAILWENGSILDLNDLLPPNSGWTLHSAEDINTQGQITGTGSHEGQRRAYLLTPPRANPGMTPVAAPQSRPRQDLKLQSGRVAKISAGEFVLDANFEDPEVRRNMTMAITPETRFFVGAGTGRISELRVGTLVMVQYFKEGARLVATSVRVAPGRQ
jgi:probable HAF family extracellular repeat protein